MHVVAGSGKRYMAHKNNMLAEQFQVMADGLAHSVTGPLAASKDLFRGISIHVNGYTRPSNLVSWGPICTWERHRCVRRSHG